LRRQAGLDQVRDAFAGTAPVSNGLHAWFEAVGLPLRVVYGQTELVGATSISARRGATFGAVGAPVAGVEVQLAADGELLVRSPALFTRYVAEPSRTQRTLAGGWLHTGDRAKILPGGELVLLGRAQSLVTARDGSIVDLQRLTERLRTVLGKAEVVLWHEPDAGVYLYVALPRVDASELYVLADADRRWTELALRVAAIDPEGVVRGWAIFEGSFGQASGEMGPTGKPRAWKIHALRQGALRFRQSWSTTPPSGEIDLRVELRSE
jgi:acyl-CoA synthetase (AMP-forming)/AMP-acid ligase II